ncbi:MAG: thioesterase domain-containing protein, partial [Chloroflexota bacterium]
VPGELYIGGAGLARGYLRRPELTAERFVAHPFSLEPGARLYRTGDLARYLPDGTIECLGRLDSQVKIHGFRIELGEIEAVLRAQTGILDAAVVMREDVPGETRAAAYLVPKEGHTIEVRAVRTGLRKSLPEYMMPSVFVVLQALPLTPNGKVDRRALPALERKPQGQPSDKYVKPVSTLHHQFARIWEELLNVRPIGITDNFFELGGHSLLAARMIERVDQACGKRIPLATLFGEPTIEHLATVLLKQEGDAIEPRIVALRAGGHKHPFFFLHGDWAGGGFYTVPLARVLGADQPFYVLTPHGVGGSTRIPRTIEASAAAHLQEIQSVTPHGPYILGGFCTDGLVAFEMAQQLRALGEQVDLLVLLDTTAEQGRRRIRRVIEGAGRLAGLDADATLDLYLRLCIYDTQWKTFQALERGEQLRMVLQYLHSGRAWPASCLIGNVAARKNGAGSRQTPMPSLRDLSGIYRWVTAAYKARNYPGRVAHFWAAEEYALDRHSLGKIWPAIAPNAEFHIIPGSHLSFITTHGDQLAAEIARCVEAAQIG